MNYFDEIREYVLTSWGIADRQLACEFEMEGTWPHEASTSR